MVTIILNKTGYMFFDFRNVMRNIVDDMHVQVIWSRLKYLCEGLKTKETKTHFCFRNCSHAYLCFLLTCLDRKVIVDLFTQAQLAAAAIPLRQSLPSCELIAAQASYREVNTPHQLWLQKRVASLHVFNLISQHILRNGAIPVCR